MHKLHESSASRISAFTFNAHPEKSQHDVNTVGLYNTAAKMTSSSAGSQSSWQLNLVVLKASP